MGNAIEFYLRGKNTDVQAAISIYMNMETLDLEGYEEPEIELCSETEQEAHFALNASEQMTPLEEIKSHYPMLRLSYLLWAGTYNQFYSRAGSTEILSIFKSHYIDTMMEVDVNTWWCKPLLVYNKLSDGTMELESYNGWEFEVVLPLRPCSILTSCSRYFFAVLFDMENFLPMAYALLPFFASSHIMSISPLLFIFAILSIRSSSLFRIAYVLVWVNFFPAI